MESEEMSSMTNKCCDDRREHNLAESLAEKFPLLCKGKFSMSEEKFFDMILHNIPEEYQEAYFFDVFSDRIHEEQQDILIDECEARIESMD